MSTQISRILINRSLERALLDDLLKPNANQRILMIEASAGYGKSLLLQTYDSMLEERGNERALISLDRGGMDAVSVLAALCHQLGWQRFPVFQLEVARLALPAALEVSRNIHIGFNRSQINLFENPAQRQAQMHVLTSAWFQDAQIGLHKERPTVIMIDSYNVEGTAQRSPTVSSELDIWMEDIFLTHVQLTPALRLILAGQQTPGSGLTPWERCCKRHRLGPIHNLDAWQQYANSLGVHVSSETISALCHVEDGHPYAMAMKLTSLRSWSFSL